MSGLGGSTSSRVRGDGAQRPVEGDRGINLGRPCDRARGDSSSSDSEGTHTHINVDGVIMRLKLIGDVRADTFWKKYSFSHSV